MNEKRVYLRPLTSDDATTSCRWRNDSELWKYTGKRPTCEITEAMEREWVGKVNSDRTRMNFAICLAGNDRYIGNIYVVNISNGTGELGVFIGERDCHGQGYGTEAVQLLKAEAKAAGVNSIRIRVRPENAAAIRAYQKAGASFLPRQWIEMEVSCD